MTTSIFVNGKSVDPQTAANTSPRVLMVFDGSAWFVRRLRAIEHDLNCDEKVYRCDETLGGPFTLAEGITYLQTWADLQTWAEEVHKSHA